MPESLEILRGLVAVDVDGLGRLEPALVVGQFPTLYLERLMRAAVPTHVLHAVLTVAIERALGHADVDPLLAPSRQPGVDLQANFADETATSR